MHQSVTTQLHTLPPNPGVYIFRDSNNQIIYVGKAINLINRVKSYFSPSTADKLTYKVQKLVSKIRDIEFIVTDSETQALILECTLIKKYKPYYNVRLKDDKNYPYLKINIKDDWPCIKVTRRIENDKARYFGPFTNAGAVKNTLKTLRKIFPLRSCRDEIDGKRNKPCLNYHIHRCPGPCIGAVDKETYHDLVKQLILFLEGKSETIIKDLKVKMDTASSELRYEQAALFRDQLDAIKDVIEDQRIAVETEGDADIIALVQSNNISFASIFNIRDDRLTGRESVVLDGTQDEDNEQILTSLIQQYYLMATSIPAEIIVQYPVTESELITNWLNSRNKGRVKIFTPKNGNKKKLLELAEENAKRGLELYLVKQESKENTIEVLKEVKQVLQLPKIPVRIEGYDISNLQGNEAVGSMVVFENGIADNSKYRRFKIKTVTGIDDYSMIQEVIARRIKKYISKEQNWSTLPDLFLIDGGKGHLHAVQNVMNDLKIENPILASIAKKNEEIFRPQMDKPILLPRDSKSLHLLQRVRDEAHRFAIGYHTAIHAKESKHSILDDIQGIGPKRRKVLLKTFGSITGIREASIEDLVNIPGITRAIAGQIKEAI
jgi:excinuclease ABC subunit C